MKADSPTAVKIRRAVTDGMIQNRRNKQLSMTKYADMLMMSYRSYSYIEHGINDCGMLTLLFFLIFCCDDIINWAAEVRAIVIPILETDDEWFFSI